MTLEGLAEGGARRHEGAVYGRTATATRRHLLDCPHLVRRDWHVCSRQELVAYPICDWSLDQLSGHGRIHPQTLEEAMRELGTHAGSESAIREELKFVSYDEIWLPYSRSYVALGYEGRAVASFGKTYVWVGGRVVRLPDYAERRGSGQTRELERGKTCPVCFIEMPLTGGCELHG